MTPFNGLEMPRDHYAEVLAVLTRIAVALEALHLPEPPCLHQRTKTIGSMGDTQTLCEDCGQPVA